MQDVIDHGQYIYHVQGSSPEPYRVVVTMAPLTASCTCSAADHGTPCRHRKEILAGGDPGIIRGPMDKIPAIAATAKASGWPALLDELAKTQKAERDYVRKCDNAATYYGSILLRMALGELKTDKKKTEAHADLEAAISAALPKIAALEEVEARVRKVMV